MGQDHTHANEKVFQKKSRHQTGNRNVIMGRGMCVYLVVAKCGPVACKYHMCEMRGKPSVVSALETILAARLNY